MIDAREEVWALVLRSVADGKSWWHDVPVRYAEDGEPMWAAYVWRDHKYGDTAREAFDAVIKGAVFDDYGDVAYEIVRTVSPDEREAALAECRAEFVGDFAHVRKAFERYTSTLTRAVAVLRDVKGYEPEFERALIAAGLSPDEASKARWAFVADPVAYLATAPRAHAEAVYAAAALRKFGVGAGYR